MIKSYLVLLFLLLHCLMAEAQKMPSKNKIIKSMNLANDYLMKKWPDPGAPIVHPDKTRPASIWTRAVYYEGLMAFYQIRPQEKYLDYAVQWGEKHNWNMAYNQTYTRHADNQACGQAYIELYLLDKETKRIASTKACIDSMMRTRKVDDWTWIDAIQMAMPVFARLGYVFNDTSYFGRMVQMYNCTRNKLGGGLFNEQEGLWWRDTDFVPPYTEPNGEDCYWSRGNGWVFAALVRTMDFLPENSPYYALFLKDFRKMAEALIPIQRPDGYWNVSLHDSTHFGGKELTGTALFTYGMAWGIRNGYLDRETYLPVVTKAWNSMVKHSLHPDTGMLGFVQGTGKEPKDGQPVTYEQEPNFEDYGLGCFLLAGSEVFKLKKN